MKRKTFFMVMILAMLMSIMPREMTQQAAAAAGQQEVASVEAFDRLYNAALNHIEATREKAKIIQSEKTFFRTLEVGDTYELTINEKWDKVGDIFVSDGVKAKKKGNKILVKALKRGQQKVEATLKNDTEKQKFKCQFKVVKKKAPTKGELDIQTEKLSKKVVKGKSFKIKYGKKEALKMIYTSNSKVSTLVKAGKNAVKVKAVGIGTATIKVRVRKGNDVRVIVYHVTVKKKESPAPEKPQEPVATETPAPTTEPTTVPTEAPQETINPTQTPVVSASPSAAPSATPTATTKPSGNGSSSSGNYYSWWVIPTAKPTSVPGAVVVKKQAELKAALENKDVTSVTIQTEDKNEFVIPAGDYSSKVLFVNAPLSEVDNSGLFKSITVEAIAPNTWIERAVGNSLLVKAPMGRIIVTKGAKLVNAILAKAGAEIALEVNGEVGQVTVEKTVNLTVTGNASKILPIIIGKEAGGSKVTVNTLVSIEVNAKADIVLQDGAIKSVVINKIAFAITVTTPSGKQMVVANGSFELNPATPSESPEPTKEPEETPEPSKTTEPPVETSEPTGTPDVTEEPEETETPAPTDTPAPTQTPEPAFYDVAVSVTTGGSIVFNGETVGPEEERKFEGVLEGKYPFIPNAEEGYRFDGIRVNGIGSSETSITVDSNLRVEVMFVVATSEPTATPEPTQTPKPSEEPSPSPDVTKEPEDTSEPSASPDVTEKPEETTTPTDTPEPTETPAPTPEPKYSVTVSVTTTGGTIVLKEAGTDKVVGAVAGKTAEEGVIFDELPIGKYEALAIPEEGYAFDGGTVNDADRGGNPIEFGISSGNVTIVVSFSEKETTSQVTFKIEGKQDKVVPVPKGEAPGIPADPYYPGKLFGGWGIDTTTYSWNEDKKGFFNGTTSLIDAIKELTKDGDVVVTAEFVDDGKTYFSATANNGTISADKEYVEGKGYPLNTVITFKSADAPTGMKFGWWKTEEGTIFSYKETFSHTLMYTISLEVVYVPENEEIVQMPILVPDFSFAERNGKVYATLISDCKLPANYTKAEYGIIGTYSKTLNLNLGTVGSKDPDDNRLVVNKYTGTSMSAESTYMNDVNVSTGVKDSKYTYRFVGYMIATIKYVDEITGEEKTRTDTFYSPVKTINLKEDYEKWKEK